MVDEVAAGAEPVVEKTADEIAAEALRARFKPSQVREAAPVQVEPAAAVTDAEAQAEVEGKLPDWMVKRLDRANKKESAAGVRAAAAEARAQEALDEVAKLRAQLEQPKPGKAPDPDDFDTVAAYEAAKATYEAAAKPKSATAKVEEKPSSGGMELPVHIDKEEFGDAVSFIQSNVTAETDAALRKLPAVSPDMIIAMSDIADGDKVTAQKVAEFMIAAPHMVSAIAQLPARRQASALEKAFGEYQGPKPKPEAKPAGSKAPEPTTRIRASQPAGADKGVAGGFRTFAEKRNAEEMAAGRKPW